mmetsp:Transcript_2912/g.9540  ORF Transcript_2912/g.9540 Transcript_2912/m.9540 type:complete len:264 (+) Transcript_2912:352-1143(+)
MREAQRSTRNRIRANRACHAFNICHARSCRPVAHLHACAPSNSPAPRAHEGTRQPPAPADRSHALPQPVDGVHVPVPPEPPRVPEVLPPIEQKLVGNQRKPGGEPHVARGRGGHEVAEGGFVHEAGLAHLVLVGVHELGDARDLHEEEVVDLVLPKLGAFALRGRICARKVVDARQEVEVVHGEGDRRDAELLLELADGRARGPAHRAVQQAVPLVPQLGRRVQRVRAAGVGPVAREGHFGAGPALEEEAPLLVKEEHREGAV